MRRVTVFAVAVLAIAVAVPAAADRIFLVYDEQQIDDVDRSVLLDALGYAVPRDQWRRITVTSDTSVAAIVDRYYDYWDNPSKAENPFPRSTAAIAYHIRRANKAGQIGADDSIAAGTQLRIPPLPVRAQWRNEENVRIRLYDPALKAYARIESLDDPIPIPDQVTEAIADKDHPFRVARLTLFTIPDWAKFVEQLADEDKTNPIDLPRDAVLVKGEQKLVAMELIGGECDPQQAIGNVTPYGIPKAEIERYRAELPRRLAEKPPFPLWIIDWNIGVDGGHGKKVLGVVHGVLDNLGLCALKDYVKTFDLNPRQNQEGLQQVFTAFRDTYQREKNFDAKTGPIAFAAAEEWIKHPSGIVDPADALSVSINEYVLQAVLWRFMYGSPKWVNMSFTITYPQAQVLNAMYMDKNKAATFAFVAAGNKRVKVTPGSFPQAGAMGYPNIVNVTFGKPDGFVEGALTREQDDVGVPVHIVAQGCLADGSCGSSFASPFVAVTAWLRHVFNETQPMQMRGALRRANHPAPYREKMVESRGMFDPALLLQPDGGVPLIMTNDSQGVPIANATLEVKYLRGEATDTWSTTIGATRTGARLSVFPCADAASGFCVWIDKDGDDHPPVVASLVSIAIQGGGEADRWTLADLAAKHAELWF